VLIAILDQLLGILQSKEERNKKTADFKEKERVQFKKENGCASVQVKA
jgi:hypothetical protein